MTNALIFARVSNETTRFSGSWLKVWRESKDKDPDSLPPELRVAMEVIPSNEQEMRVFDGALQALEPWVDFEGLDFQLTLPPGFLNLFANAKERRRWERLKKERSLSTDWNTISYIRSGGSGISVSH